MKKVLGVIVLAVLCGMLVGCGRKATEEKKYENSKGEMVTLEELVADLKPSDWSKASVAEDVILSSEFEVWPTDSQTIFCHFLNNSERAVSHSEASVEFFYNDQWYWLPFQPYNVAGAGQFTYPGVESAVMKGLGLYTFPFPPGKYRVCFEYDFYEYGNFDRGYVAFAEFEMSDELETVEFSNIKRQSMRERRAVKDGCVVLANGMYQNLDLAAEFLRKAQSGVACQMRIVDMDQKIVRDIIYEPMTYPVRNKYTVVTLEDGELTTEYFTHLTMTELEEPSQIVLSNINLLQFMETEEVFFSQEWDVKILLEKQETPDEVWTELIEDFQWRIRYHYPLERSWMEIYSGTGDRKMLFGRSSMKNYFRMVTSDGEYIDHESPAEEGEPIYIFAIGDVNFGVLFQCPDQTYLAACYDSSTGEILTTLTGELEEIILALRQQDWEGLEQNLENSENSDKTQEETAQEQHSELPGPEIVDQTPKETPAIVDPEAHSLAQQGALAAYTVLTEYITEAGYPNWFYDEAPEWYGGEYINEEHVLIIKVLPGYPEVVAELEARMPEEAVYTIEDAEIAMTKLRQVQVAAQTKYASIFSTVGITEREGKFIVVVEIHEDHREEIPGGPVLVDGEDMSQYVLIEITSSYPVLAGGS